MLASSGFALSSPAPLAAEQENRRRASPRSEISTLSAGFPDQVGISIHRQRIGAVNFEEVAGRDRLNALRVFSAGSGITSGR